MRVVKSHTSSRTDHRKCHFPIMEMHFHIMCGSSHGWLIRDSGHRVSAMLPRRFGSGQITLTIVAACILASCERSSLNNEGQASSSTSSGGKSANTVARSLIDSAHLAPSALVPSQSQAANTLTGIVGLTCTPTSATLKDTITLRMETPHGEYLTVTQPDSTSFFSLIRIRENRATSSSFPQTASRRCRQSDSKLT